MGRHTSLPNLGESGGMPSQENFRILDDLRSIMVRSEPKYTINTLLLALQNDQ